MDSQIYCGSFSGFYNLIVKLLLYLGHNFLDACRVNATVSNKLMECQTAYFSSNRIKSRYNDSFGSIGDNNLHTCRSLQGTNISTLTTDDTSFHFIIINMENTHRIFNGCFCCHTLNGLYHHFLGLLVGIELGLIHDFIHIAGRIQLGLVFQTFNQTALGFFRAEPRELL